MAGHDDERLSMFAEQIFDELNRADQRRWARIYLQGLLNAPGAASPSAATK